LRSCALNPQINADPIPAVRTPLLPSLSSGHRGVSLWWQRRRRGSNKN